MSGASYLAGGFLGFLSGAVLNGYFNGEYGFWIVIVFAWIFCIGYLVMKGMDNGETTL